MNGNKPLSDCIEKQKQPDFYSAAPGIKHNHNRIIPFISVSSAGFFFVCVYFFYPLSATELCQKGFHLVACSSLSPKREEGRESKTRIKVRSGGRGQGHTRPSFTLQMHFQPFKQGSISSGCDLHILQPISFSTYTQIHSDPHTNTHDCQSWRTSSFPKLFIKHFLYQFSTT